MENKIKSNRKMNVYLALNMYVAVCVVLVLIILYGAFQRTDGGTLSGEIYLRPNSAQVIGN